MAKTGRPGGRGRRREQKQRAKTPQFNFCWRAERSGTDIECEMFEAAMNKLGWITRVINMSSGEETGRVEFVQNLSPSTTLAGTLISGTAGAGTALEIPDGNSYVVGPSAIKLAAGYVAIQQP